LLKYWLLKKIRGKTKDLTSRKISGVKMLMNTKNYSNREIFRTLQNSESSVRWIKKKINLGEELSPLRTNKCGRKPNLTPRSERYLKKHCLENSFSTTKQIKLNLKTRGIIASERTVRHNLSKMNFKAHRLAWKPKLTPAMVAKSLAWAKDHKDRDLDSKSVYII